MEIRDRLDARRGYVKAVVTVSRRQDSNGPYYAVTSREGDDYTNEIRRFLKAEYHGGRVQPFAFGIGV
jgi:hypothetical protein